MTGRLVTAANLHDPDRFYAAYVNAHQGLPEEASELLNARLVLILANHIGDHAVLTEALRLAAVPPTAQVAPAVNPNNKAG